MASKGSLNNSETAICRLETTPLVSVQTATQRRGRKFRSYLSNLACFLYVIFLLWQLVGSVLYFMRAYYCCLKERHASFRCKNFTVIPHSQELELSWLICQDVNAAVLVFALSRVSGFLGYSVIFLKSVRMPAFWTLWMLHTIQIIGFGVIIYLNRLSSMEICLIIAFCFHGITLLGMVWVLNFTPVLRVKNSNGYFAFLLCKLTLVTLFVQIFTIFVVGTVCWIHFFCHDGAGYLRIRRSHSAHTSQLLENRRNSFYYYTACMRSQSVTPPLDLILPRTKPCLQNYLIKCEI